MSFKVGDRVRMKEECTGCVKGKVYELKKRIGGSSGEELYAHCYEEESGCSCQYKWELVTPEFKIGDRVRCINKGVTWLSAGWKEGKEFVIKEILDFGVNGNAYFPDYGSGVYEESLELVKEPKMNKYTELKHRIDALNEYTILREFGSLLLEVGSSNYYLCMPTAAPGYFEIQNNGRRILNNEASVTPCDAIPILKKEFTWLLEHSQHKDTRKEELEKLKVQVAELNKKIEEMEK